MQLLGHSSHLCLPYISAAEFATIGERRNDDC
ncbi:hypothetical protein TSAR_007929 [Trichomalopsis sarcophagae]|uniref:Uncharacterized protein n=1 Tax=Trichomalopsis sarcophagae TaxID=543379 RepID=A0A232FBU6_9HYME|nr:hypothetical protein TSAR_007929 [Trichomalopsis sarcophagae]